MSFFRKNRGKVYDSTFSSLSGSAVPTPKQSSMFARMIPHFNRGSVAPAPYLTPSQPPSQPQWQPFQGQEQQPTYHRQPQRQQPTYHRQQPSASQRQPAPQLLNLPHVPEELSDEDKDTLSENNDLKKSILKIVIEIDESGGIEAFKKKPTNIQKINAINSRISKIQDKKFKNKPFRFNVKDGKLIDLWNEKINNMYDFGSVPETINEDILILDFNKYDSSFRTYIKSRYLFLKDYCGRLNTLLSCLDIKAPVFNIIIRDINTFNSAFYNHTTPLIRIDIISNVNNQEIILQRIHDTFINEVYADSKIYRERYKKEHKKQSSVFINLLHSASTFREVLEILKGDLKKGKPNVASFYTNFLSTMNDFFYVGKKQEELKTKLIELAEYIKTEYIKDTKLIESFNENISMYEEDRRNGGRRKSPKKKPTKKPTKKPITKPTKKPITKPTKKPTTKPTKKPTKKPITKPTKKPTAKPMKKKST